MATVKIVLPWPAKELSPNNRSHWSVKSKRRKVAREHAAWLTRFSLGMNWPLGNSSASVLIEFSPPDRRRRDIDNMLSSSKALLDGVADGIGIDDSKWSIGSIRRADDFAGEVRVTVEGFA